MPLLKATACACSNIAFIKYWGNRDDALRIPVNGSISMNLDGLYTRTTVTFDPNLNADSALVDGREMSGGGMTRISHHLDQVRRRAGVETRARIESVSNFPAGVGIASSASAFAALSLAAVKALDLRMSEAELSALARLGSGSASRSIPTGFVEWFAGDSHESSFAASIAPVDHWALVDVVALVSKAHKATGSTEGHHTAATSPLQAARVADAARRLDLCRKALLSRDFEAFAEVVEQDSDIMHAIMMTGRPALFYWQPATLTIMAEVRRLRASGLPLLYTIDAGPNVHCLCPADYADQVDQAVRALPGVVDTLRAGVGHGAWVES
ncbi:MAG: diphosphomevalonate decarboxylase [Anaerolinea sp.]|nr:diphosphomevalonate decarboxylase [Anaerolinea sp.]